MVGEKPDVTFAFSGTAEPYERGLVMLRCRLTLSVDGTAVWESGTGGLPADPPAGKALTDPGGRAALVDSLAKSVGRMFITPGDLPAHLGRGAGGPVAVPGMSLAGDSGTFATTVSNLVPAQSQTRSSPRGDRSGASATTSRPSGRKATPDWSRSPRAEIRSTHAGGEGG